MRHSYDGVHRSDGGDGVAVELGELIGGLHQPGAGAVHHGALGARRGRGSARARPCRPARPAAAPPGTITEQIFIPGYLS